MVDESSEEARAVKLTQKFEKNSLQTKVFEEWAEPVRKFFLSKVQLEVGEIPVFGHYKDDTSWLLCTTRRVTWSNPNESSGELRNDNIKEVGWSHGPEGWFGRDDTSKPDAFVIIDGHKQSCKHHSPWLHLIDSADKRYEVFLEPGEVLIAIRTSLWRLSAGWNSWRDQPQALAKKMPTETGSDPYRSARLEFTFKKFSYKFKETRLFSNCDANLQEFLKSRVALGSEEQPVIGFYRNSEAWFLATSRRIIYPYSGKTHYIWYQEIENMGWSEGPNATGHCAHERVVYIHNVRHCKACLSTSPWLFLLGPDGVRQEISIEPSTSIEMSDCFGLMKRLELIHPRAIDEF